MCLLKNSNYYVKYLLAILAFFVCGWFFYNGVICPNGITRYQAWRDKAAIKKLMHDNYLMLYYGDWDKISVDDFDVDFMLDNASSSQVSKHSNLIMKVMRDGGKTVGFLAYYPKSPYWWQMLFLVVDENYRGKGHAAKLIQYFIDDAVRRGAIKLTTFTRLVNTKARSLYEGKFGFKDIAHHHDKYMDLVLYPKHK